MISPLPLSSTLPGRIARVQSATRLLHIDGLRGLAIFLVLVTHTWVFSGAPALSTRVFGHRIVLAALPAVAHVGVNLFLVLSGFCLTWPFVRDISYRERMTMLRFFGRRVRRIVPAYYSSIVIVLVLAFMWAKLRGLPFALPSWQDVSLHLAFVHNLSPEHASTINGPYWSLALEFQLYLAFPLFYEVLRKWGAVSLLAACLLLQLTYRIALEQTLPPDVLSAYDFVLPKALLGRMSDFVCGMIVAYAVVAEERGGRTSPTWVPFAAVGFLATGFIGTCWHLLPESLLDIAWSLGFASLVWWACRSGRCNRVFCFKPIVYLGIISYSVYLLHQPIIERVCAVIRTHFKPDPSFIIALIVLPLVVAICFLFYSGCEKRFFDWFAERDKKRTTQPPIDSPKPLAIHMLPAGD